MVHPVQTLSLPTVQRDFKTIQWKDGTFHKIQDNLPSAKQEAISAAILAVVLPIFAAAFTVIELGKTISSAAFYAKHRICGDKAQQNEAMNNVKEHAFFLFRSIIHLVPGASFIHLAYYLHITCVHPGNPDVRIRDWGVVNTSS
jgi:hypothetical protein